MDPLSIFDTSGIAISEGGGILSIFFKIAVGLFLLGYTFFAFFLYLRVRILSLTLTTPNSGGVRYLSLLHLFAVIGLAIFLTFLLLF